MNFIAKSLNTYICMLGGIFTALSAFLDLWGLATKLLKKLYQKTALHVLVKFFYTFAHLKR